MCTRYMFLTVIDMRLYMPVLHLYLFLSLSYSVHHFQTFSDI